ncbi:hypothetical protein QVZ41_01995 [Wenyingzhuangia sp. chi5]|uniref:EpsG-like glucosyltransferase n=1 Tax=Wenyingzhuangia gilva TaxID=3057677 RepID=A0ABT8VNS1_9FLAO|nr:hypothetical protein [Wenyingzhuangia sp. chi5]MDO3693619.1 hypothetical protein [Wenyingzhuangia sp. chi5]
MNILELGICVGVLGYVGYLLKKKLELTTSVKIKTFLVLFTLIHYSVSIVFAVYLNSFSNINDPKDFFTMATDSNSWLPLLGLGHDFIAFLIYPLVKAGVGIEVLFLIFATISYVAFFKYFKLIGIRTLEKTSILYLLFYLIPTIHVWTAFLGKEPLLLWLMVVLLEIINNKKSNVLTFLVLGLIFLIRPHVGLILLFVLFLFKLSDKKTPKKYKIKIVVTFIILICVGIILLMKFFLKFESLSLESILRYIESFNSGSEDKGGSAISIEDTNIGTRILYLLWMPLPYVYKIKNTLQALVALENIYYVGVMLYIGFVCIKNKLKMTIEKEVQFSFMAAVALMLLFASYLYNLGLGNRMKIMFLPYFFYGWIQIDKRLLDKTNGYEKR